MWLGGSACVCGLALLGFRCGKMLGLEESGGATVVPWGPCWSELLQWAGACLIPIVFPGCCRKPAKPIGFSPWFIFQHLLWGIFIIHRHLVWHSAICLQDQEAGCLLRVAASCFRPCSCFAPREQEKFVPMFFQHVWHSVTTLLMWGGGY